MTPGPGYMTQDGRAIRLQAHADALWQAERDQAPIPSISGTDPELTVDDAYAIQTHNVERRLAEGRVVRGRKIGLTSRAMQQMLGVDEPDFGVLFDDMLIEDSVPIDLGRLCQPKVEAEIGFLLGQDLTGPGVMAADVLRATAGLLPVLEVVDSRLRDWKITLVDTVADNASSARAVLGGRLTPAQEVKDLPLLGMVFSRNGTVEATGTGAAALGNPAACVAWLANKLAAFEVGLSKGQVVLSGALHAAVDLADGDAVRADFADLGSVAATFTGRPAGRARQAGEEL
jgi:2-keto-4-pentenoate hydratase